MGINKVILVGRLGADPEIRYTANKDAIANFSLATTEKRKNADGQYSDYTEWHKIVCFGKLGELARDYLKKGRQVYLEGKLRTTKWQDKEGKDRYTTEIVVATLEFLGAKNQEAEPAFDNPFADLKTADSLITSASSEDDIPF